MAQVEMLCLVGARQPQGVDLTLREKINSVVSWFCFGLCGTASPFRAGEGHEVLKITITVPANATKARSSPKAEAF